MQTTVNHSEPLIHHRLTFSPFVLVHFYRNFIFIFILRTLTQFFVFGCCVRIRFLFPFSFSVAFYLISPEFSYRPGLSALSEDASTNNASGQSAGGPPNRPLPPTPDDDDQQGDRTLIMKRVRVIRIVQEIICHCHYM